MRIRTARPADVAAILEIEDQSFRTDNLTPRKLAHLMTRGHCALLCAEEGGVVAGYVLVLFRRGAQSARIYGVAVRASLRGRGTGAALVRAAEERAAQLGRDRITLEVAVDNVSAIALYVRLGYERVLELGPYYEDGTAALRYAKPLGGGRKPARSRDSCLHDERRVRSNPECRGARASVARCAAREPLCGPSGTASSERNESTAKKKAAAKKPAKKAPTKKPAKKGPASRGSSKEE